MIVCLVPLESVLEYGSRQLNLYIFENSQFSLTTFLYTKFPYVSVSYLWTLFCPTNIFVYFCIIIFLVTDCLSFPGVPSLPLPLNCFTNSPSYFFQLYSFIMKCISQEFQGNKTSNCICICICLSRLLNERQVCLTKLAHAIVGASNFEICRAGLQAGNSGGVNIVGLSLNFQDSRLKTQARVSLLHC